MSQPKSGQYYGKWALVDRLGGGGNADVWRARDSSGNDVAIKILRQRKPSTEPFKRFQQEVATVQRLTSEGFTGILPILEANFPSVTRLTGRAWFAAPVATPIIEALRTKAKLEDVVAAVAAIADTLARLADRNLAHRDIKPENIYRYDDQWVIGDFGLVQVSGSALTEDATKLGPQYYLAPEMLNSPWRAQGAPADVYSLAKTLWVLATGHKFPIPGQHDFEHPAATISAYVNHPRAKILDLILHEATVFEPSQRPTAATVKAELSDWLGSSNGSPGAHNLTEIKQQLKLATSRISSVQDREGRKQREFESLSAHLLDYMNKAPKIISSAGLPLPTLSDKSDNFRYFSPGRALYVGQQILDPKSRYMHDKAVYVEVGVGVKYLQGGDVEIKAAHALLEARKTGYSPTDFPHGWDIYRSESIWIKTARGRLGDSNLLLACDEIGEHFLSELPQALRALADRILLISTHITNGETWDRYMAKLPPSSRPRNDPFIKFEWHKTRKRHRDD